VPISRGTVRVERDSVFKQELNDNIKQLREKYNNTINKNDYKLGFGDGSLTV
jgi:hypothetical protein